MVQSIISEFFKKFSEDTSSCTSKRLKAEMTCYLNKTVISFDKVFHPTEIVD